MPRSAADFLLSLKDDIVTQAIVSSQRDHSNINAQHDNDDSISKPSSLTSSGKNVFGLADTQSGAACTMAPLYHKGLQYY